MIYGINLHSIKKYQILIIKWSFIFLLCIIPFISYCQSLSETDSALILYESDSLSDKELLPVLEILANYSDPNDKLIYSNELIALSLDLNESDYLYVGYLNKGNALRMKSELVQALESYFNASKVAEENSMTYDLNRLNISIADIYSERGDHTNATRYYLKAINSIQEGNSDSLGLAKAYENLGDEYLNYNMPDSALFYFNKSGAIFENLNDLEGIAYNFGNRGIALAELGKDEQAKDFINKAITQLEMMENYYPISIFLTYMSDIYLNQSNTTVALNYARRSLDLATKYDLKDQIRDAHYKLSELYERTDDYKNSLIHYKSYKAYVDSVNNYSSIQDLANMRSDFEIAKKQIEVDLLNQQKKNQKIVVIGVISALVVLIIFAIGLVRRNRFIEHTNGIIEREKARSDNLLLNILPEEIAQELKENGKVKARKFEEVSVMFADFIGFTRHSNNLSPEVLVTSVDFFFSKFDAIIEKNGLEKVKTIGDAYMCAAGLPFPEKDHAQKIICAAVEILEFVENVKKETPEGIVPFDIRIGINSGPVVAGVVGTKKFVYDIWGDTVNIASRMESNSESGKINISETTFDLIKEKYECISRGEIDVKNKGLMKMYFISDSLLNNENNSIKDVAKHSSY
ncbi:adenylate/guanylate cyclase domain-containing protein [Marinigracilibium pacificum]|uniref:Adenylate cyclase n=1 Tax=Marinigracilibium pacificum TaxID=2729599 RepID=A0A848IW40_9BACT|nr:adenylate/guanylate cyclase domain-containing protein [Marinigracilibium pacificum]NMM47906.1 tetratricopeptide repeat protein [Marinigracilibium pacificum]